MYPTFIYLSIYFLFYFVLFIYFFLLECLWSANMLRIEGRLAFTKPHLFGQLIFTRNRAAGAGSDHD